MDDKYLNNEISKLLGSNIIFAQRFSKLFLKQKYGNIIFISSILGFNAPKFHHYINTSMHPPIEYGASKAGIIQITKYLAKYYKDKNIRFNCISPGGIKDSQPASFLKKYRSDTLNKGMLDSKDILGALLFLLSNESLFINGQNIVIDDGWSL